MPDQPKGHFAVAVDNIDQKWFVNNTEKCSIPSVMDNYLVLIRDTKNNILFGITNTNEIVCSDIMRANKAAKQFMKTAYKEGGNLDWWKDSYFRAEKERSMLARLAKDQEEEIKRLEKLLNR